MPEKLTSMAGPPGIPVLKVENSPPLRAKIPENSRYLIPPYIHLSLSANKNLTKSDHLSIAMSNVNIIVLGYRLQIYQQR